jgi:hypothetical protein
MQGKLLTEAIRNSLTQTGAGRGAAWEQKRGEGTWLSCNTISKGGDRLESNQELSTVLENGHGKKPFSL